MESQGGAGDDLGSESGTDESEKEAIITQDDPPHDDTLREELKKSIPPLISFSFFANQSIPHFGIDPNQSSDDLTSRI